MASRREQQRSEEGADFDVPRSVFYKGIRKPRHTNSFDQLNERQAKNRERLEKRRADVEHGTTPKRKKNKKKPKGVE